MPIPSILLWVKSVRRREMGARQTEYCRACQITPDADINRCLFPLSKRNVCGGMRAHKIFRTVLRTSSEITAGNGVMVCFVCVCVCSGVAGQKSLQESQIYWTHGSGRSGGSPQCHGAAMPRGRFSNSPITQLLETSYSLKNSKLETSYSLKNKRGL